MDHSEGMGHSEARDPIDAVGERLRVRQPSLNALRRENPYPGDMATLEEKIKYALEVSDRLVSNDVAEDEAAAESELRLIWSDSLVCVSIVSDEEVIASEEAIGGIDTAIDMLIQNVLGLLSSRMERDLEIRNKAPG